MDHKIFSLRNPVTNWDVSKLFGFQIHFDFLSRQDNRIATSTNTCQKYTEYVQLLYVLILCPIPFLQHVKSFCYISKESHLVDGLRNVLKTMGYQGTCTCTTQNTAHTMMNDTFRLHSCTFAKVAQDLKIMYSHSLTLPLKVCVQNPKGWQGGYTLRSNWVWA